MNWPKPKSSKEYPWYILGYWVFAWMIGLLYVVVTSLFSITPDGKYVEKRDCLESIPSGRYEEGEECIEYSDPYYVPVGTQLRYSFKSSGLLTGSLALLIGGYAMYKKRKEEIEEEDSEKYWSDKVAYALASEGADPLLSQAFDLLNNHETINASLLRKHLHVGTKRAREILAQLIKNGLARDPSW